MERTYRRKLEHTGKYWYVDLGPMNFNETASYPFPSREAAVRFAAQSKQRAAIEYRIDREVSVRAPDGSVETIEFAYLQDPETSEWVTLFGPLKGHDEEAVPTA